ncbi:protein of unknown function [Paraburkholderia kururiensis]
MPRPVLRFHPRLPLRAAFTRRHHRHAHRCRKRRGAGRSVPSARPLARAALRPGPHGHAHAGSRRLAARDRNAALRTLRPRDGRTLPRRVRLVPPGAGQPARGRPGCSQRLREHRFHLTHAVVHERYSHGARGRGARHQRAHACFLRLNPPATPNPLKKRIKPCDTRGLHRARLRQANDMELSKSRSVREPTQPIEHN